MAIDYLLYESGVGYAVSSGLAKSCTSPLANGPLKVFKVAIQADTIGNNMTEVQKRSQDLATFGGQGAATRSSSLEC